jgi:hypothetical protein
MSKLLSCVLACVAACTAIAHDERATLEAIRQVENPRELTRPGASGELGPWQFKAATWRMHTSKPHRLALDRDEALRVALLHHAWICRGLAKAGLPQDAYHVALAWNSGLHATVHRRSPARAHRYAERVANLAASLTSSR